MLTISDDSLHELSEKNLNCEEEPSAKAEIAEKEEQTRVSAHRVLIGKNFLLLS